MQDPVGVPAKGGATFALVTRPDETNTTETVAGPGCPVAQARTAADTSRIALMTSERDGDSGPPAAGGVPPELELPVELPVLGRAAF